MEKIMSVEERIRRAEEIYARRQNKSGVRVSTNNVNLNKKNLSLFKKMIYQMIICIIIYTGFYFIKNSNYIFSKNIMQQTKQILAYDMNFKKIYNQITENINKYNTNTTSTTNENVEENNIEENLLENTSYNENSGAGIGGGSENLEESMNTPEKSQMEIDAEYIKTNFCIVKPLEGIVTSNFGSRIATEIISANHEGIDIGADAGTEIKAAIEGTVILCSTYGDYGNHLKIESANGVTTLYAHCSELLVKNGDYVTVGQTIAKVGETRKSNRTSPSF